MPAPGANPAEAMIFPSVAEPRTVLVAPCCPTDMQRPGAWRVEDFELHKQLYKGKASLLYRSTCRLSGRTIALKLYRKARLSALNFFQVRREIRIHAQLQHEHIIQLYAAFEDSEHVYLALEYASGGDLYEELKRKGGHMSEQRVAADVILPCLSALRYLHAKGFLWRDCKPENMLLAEARGRTVKLADFGLSIDATEERPVTRAGTLDYMAPEVLLCPEKSHPQENKERALLAYTAAVDAWAVGVLAYELVVGHPPFERETRSDTLEQIMYRRPAYPAWLSEPCRAFIATALTKSAAKRPTVLDLLAHPWVLAHLPKEAKPLLSVPAVPAVPAQETPSKEELRSPKETAAPQPPQINISVDCVRGAAAAPQPELALLPAARPNAPARAVVALPAELPWQPSRESEQQESALQSLMHWAGSSVQRLSSRLLAGGRDALRAAAAPGRATAEEELAEASEAGSTASMQPEMRQSHEDSLALLFYPPPPAAGQLQQQRAHIWGAEASPSAAGKPAPEHKLLLGAGSLQENSGSGVIPAVYPVYSMVAAAATGAQPKRSTSPRGDLLGSAALPAASQQQPQPQLQASSELYGPNGRLFWASPAGWRQRARAESSGSLASTPPRRSYVKFPSAKDGSPVRLRVAREERP